MTIRHGPVHPVVAGISAGDAAAVRGSAHVASGACLNCAASLTGAFCANCGQRDVPPYPSARDLVVDAFWELSGWDGRFASTLRALIQRPGMLTHEFLEGRRVRYISPLRLYLMTSLVYFLLAAAAPNVSLKSGVTLAGGPQVQVSPNDATLSRPDRVAKIAKGAMTNSQSLSPADREAALQDVAKAPELMRPFLRRAIGDPAGLKRGILETMPRMLFALLPVFAAIVALFYQGRKYPEHLYFAIHLHAFIFLAFGVTALLRLTRTPALAGIASLIAVVWIPVYATLAFRRVYGGSVVRTLAKEIAIAALYAVASGTAFIAMLYWISISK